MAHCMGKKSDRRFETSFFSMIEILMIWASTKFFLYEEMKWFVDYQFNNFMTKIIRSEHFTADNLENTLFYI